MSTKIGFIGLGLMGAAMVGRLQDKGHSLTVLGNRNRAGVEAALARGATEAGTARELAAACDIVMHCVGTSDQVEGRMRGADGVIAGLSAGKVVIDFGTSLPHSTIALGDEVAATGAVMLDSPIGRTPMHAKDGLLNLMCSGDKATYDAVKPVLDDLGENVFHLGTLGTGHKIKLMNNFFSQCVANAMAEAFALADKTGVDKQAMFDVINAGPNSSPMMEFIRAYAIDGNPNMLAFSVKNALKDVGYYRQMAEAAGATSLMGNDIFAALTEATETGRGEDMVPQMVDYYTAKFGA